jgi:outer membrane receptor protein involved in Fe transport
VSVTVSRWGVRQRDLLNLIAVLALAVAITVGGAFKAGAQDRQVPASQQQTTRPAASQPAASTPAATPMPAPAEQRISAPVRADRTRLPQIVVSAAKNKPRAKPVAPRPQPEAPPADAATAAQTALDAKTQEFNTARDNNLLTKLGASTTSISRAAIERMPQADNAPLDKLILQFPGVSYDSAASNPNFHIRGEYANVQTRINGVVVPEGVSGLGAFLDTNFIGNISLLTGALPAEYGLRTAGVLDITSRNFSTPGGEVSLYGGSRQTFTPSIDYGGGFGNSQYFVSARGNWNGLGIENPAPTLNAIHDETQQGKFFGYVSTMLDESTRFSVISAASYSQFQIPGNPGQSPTGDFPAPTPDSTAVHENEFDTYLVTIATLQKHGTDGDAQLAFFSRYADVHFLPDVPNDLAFNDVASDVKRQSTLTGTQFDTSYILNDRHTLRGGFAVTGEQTNVSNVSTVLPVDPITGLVPPGSEPFTITDQTSMLGWNIGTYVQDEWKLTNQLTLNTGMRFDQLYQFVDANQLSPRFALVYKPLEGTTFHAGYARYFTPPYQAQATQTNIALFTATPNTNTPAIPLADPVKPERANYFDVGIDQTVLPGLNMGIDMYYKEAKDMIDDGQFGQAVVLTQFNWAHGYSEGGEFKLSYNNGNFNAYGNFAYNISRAIGPESSQYLFSDAATFAYLQTHYHYTDDMQRMTGSAGASYRFMDSTTISADMIYGSGLRAGDLPNFAPNALHTTSYAVVNTGISHDYRWSTDYKPLTLRFDVTNLFDQIYELRDGSGIGVFAPQFGARRGYYFGLAQKL